MKFKVCCIIPPSSNLKVIHDYAGGLGFELNSEYTLPCLDMLQLATCISQSKYFDVHYYDMAFEDPINSIMENFTYDICIVNISLALIEENIQFIKTLNKFIPKIYARIPITNHKILKEILESSHVWACIISECENDIESILLGKSDIGLAYIRNSNLVITQQSKTESLDTLPTINFDFVTKYKYQYPKLGDCLTLQTSRGCPFSCSYYCPYPLTQGKKIRFRNVELILRDILSIKERGVDKIFFRDAVFTFDKERILDLCDRLVKRNIMIEWWCETRADFLDDFLLNKMAIAGCKGINIGVESGEPSLRNSYLKKGVTNEILLRVSDLAKTHNIKLAFLLMVGSPGEDRQSVVKTAELIGLCKPFSIGISFPVAYPDTAFYRDVQVNNWLHTNQQADLYHGGSPSVICDKWSVESLIEAKNLVLKYFSAVQERNLDFETTALSNIKEWATSL